MQRKKKRAHMRRLVAACLSLVVAAVAGTTRSHARAETSQCFGPSQGQAVHVPAYSHIYSGDREAPFYLAVTLSIRNTDPARSLTVVSVEYHGSDGKLIRKYLESPLGLEPLASAKYVIKESDASGGSGASFVVTWRSERPVSPPLIESVMIGTQGQQGVSFTSRGQVIRQASE